MHAANLLKIDYNATPARLDFDALVK